MTSIDKSAGSTEVGAPRFRIGSVVARYPEVVFSAVAWTPALFLSWLRYGVSGPPYSESTLWTVVMVLALTLVPLWLVGGPLRYDSGGMPRNLERIGKANRWKLLLICNLSVVLAMGIFAFLRKDLIGLGVDGMRDARAEVSGRDEGPLGRLSYFPMALSLAGPMLAIRLSKRLRTSLLYGLVLVGLFVMFFMATGLRTETLPLIAVLAAALLSSEQLHRRGALLRVGMVVSVGTALLLFLNSVLATLGLTGGLQGAGMAAVSTRGARLLQSIELQDAPEAILMTAGHADEYLLAPIFYLDFYFHCGESDIAMGSHQFDTLTRRFGIPDATELGRQVNDLYLDIGITHNVWATSIREMCIDFGNTGALIAFLVAGVTTGLAKRFRDELISADWIYCLGFAYLLATPCLSLFKSQFMEMALYASLFSVVLEVGIMTTVGQAEGGLARGLGASYGGGSRRELRQIR